MTRVLAGGAVALLVAAAVSLWLLDVRVLVVANGSMAPALPVGSVAITRPVDAAAIVPRDVVTFHAAGRSVPVTHRVVEIRPTHDGRALWTKGDANDTPDPHPVTLAAGDEIARVQAVVPHAGYLLLITGRSRPGAVVALVLLGLAYADRTVRRRSQAAPQQPAHPPAPVA